MCYESRYLSVSSVTFRMRFSDISLRAYKNLMHSPQFPTPLPFATACRHAHDFGYFLAIQLPQTEQFNLSCLLLFSTLSLSLSTIPQPECLSFSSLSRFQPLQNHFTPPPTITPPSYSETSSTPPSTPPSPSRFESLSPPRPSPPPPSPHS